MVNNQNDLLENKNGRPTKEEQELYDSLTPEYEKHNAEGDLRDLPSHPRYWPTKTVQENVDLQEFDGEWLNWDPDVNDWLLRNIVVSGVEFLAYDTPPNKHKPGKGYVYNGQVYIYFADGEPARRHRPVKLVNKNTIRFVGDPEFDEWIRKGSDRDPYLKFGNALKFEEGKSSRDILAAVRATMYPKQYMLGEGQYRYVAREWMNWVATADEQWKLRLVDEEADIMQRVPRLVRYLALALTHDYQFDEESRKALVKKYKEKNEELDLEKVTREATKQVHRRIASLFAAMSDKENFEEWNVSDASGGGAGSQAEKVTFDQIKGELINHAVPIIISKLPTEEDIETRKCFATVLGNLREDITIDALVTSLVSDQQVRSNRQKMIAEYYLQPSKQQSDEASEILRGAVMAAKRTLSLLQSLNVIIFLAGVIILVGGLYISITQENSRVTGALVGLGGFAGVITLLVNDPLNRIQNSLSNLVQLEAAFTSFIWELNLNSTYIQSQYVNKGRLDEGDVAHTLVRIEDAMDFTLNQVATYTDEGREVIVPHLTQISSSLVKKNVIRIQVYGNHLKVGAKGKEATEQIGVSVNHVPIQSAKVPDKRNVVSFDLKLAELPKSINPSNETIWISLVINGFETNALALNLAMVNEQPEVETQSETSKAPQGDQPAEPETETVTVTAVPAAGD